MGHEAHEACMAGSVWQCVWGSAASTAAVAWVALMVAWPQRVSCRILMGTWDHEYLQGQAEQRGAAMPWS